MPPRAAFDSQGFEFRGRRFTAQEITLIQELVASCARVGRQELAATIAELLQWQRPNGCAKVRECRDLLEKMMAHQLLELPELRRTKPRGSTTTVRLTDRGGERELLTGTVAEIAPVNLQLVKKQHDRLLWRELVGRYHYLGHKVPFGAHLRYLIQAHKPEPVLVGCVQMSSPAWRIRARDRWIGWDDPCRARNLQRIVNNSRFLLLPWVKVRNLASFVLAALSRRIVPDWEAAYGVRPLLLETFVDHQRFKGTCYRAANWTWLGLTQGRGRMDRQKTRVGAAPKDIFVYPLAKNARTRLRAL